MVFRTHDAKGGADLPGMVPDRGGDAADTLDVLLVVNGKTGCPDARRLPAEGGRGGNGLGRLLFEGGATDYPLEFLLGQPRCEDLADGRAVDRSCGPDLLDNPHGPLGLTLGDDRHDPVAQDGETRAFTRAAAQGVEKRHRDLGKLLPGPRASSQTEKFGRKRISSSVALLDEVAEFDKRTKKMIGRTPGQRGLSHDLGERCRAADPGNDLDDAESPLEGLMGLV